MDNLLDYLRPSTMAEIASDLQEEILDLQGEGKRFDELQVMLDQVLLKMFETVGEEKTKELIFAANTAHVGGMH